METEDVQTMFYKTTYKKRTPIPLIIMYIGWFNCLFLWFKKGFVQKATNLKSFVRLTIKIKDNHQIMTMNYWKSYFVLNHSIQS